MSERMTDEEFARIEKARDGLEILGIDVDDILAEARRARASEAELVKALEHMQWCRSCGESSWEDCEGGRAALVALSEVKSEDSNG